MPVAWFLCPYDMTDRGVGARPYRFVRTPAIKRHSATDAQAVRWVEGETIGNHCLVKVDASSTMLDTLRADSDFLELPAIVPQNRRNTVRSKLNALGFNDVQIDATNFETPMLIALLLTGSPQTLAQISARLPG